MVAQKLAKISYYWEDSIFLLFQRLDLALKHWFLEHNIDKIRSALSSAFLSWSLRLPNSVFGTSSVRWRREDIVCPKNQNSFKKIYIKVQFNKQNCTSSKTQRNSVALGLLKAKKKMEDHERCCRKKT